MILTLPGCEYFFFSDVGTEKEKQLVQYDLAR